MLNKKSDNTKIATLVDRVDDLEKRELDLVEEVAKYKKTDVIVMENDLDEAKEEVHEVKGMNEDLSKENELLRDKTTAIAKTIENLSENLIALKRKHKHELELMKDEMTMSTERLKTLLATSKIIKSDVFSFAQQLLDKASKVKVTHELTEASLEMQLADILDKVKVAKVLNPLPEHLEDDLKDHLRSKLNTALLNTATDAYTDTYLNVLAINTSRELM